MFSDYMATFYKTDSGELDASIVSSDDGTYWFSLAIFVERCALHKMKRTKLLAGPQALMQFAKGCVSLTKD